MTPFLNFILNPRVLVIVGVVSTVGLGWWHYTSLRADLSDARAELKTAEETINDLADIADANAASLASMEARYQHTISILEELSARQSEMSSRIEDEIEHVNSAPKSDDGDVAPLLESLRKRRFSGGSNGT